MTNKRTIRTSPIAGTWYPGNPNQLRNMVAGYLDTAKNPDLPGQVVGLVAPHAGYVYSGAVAGHAFKTVQGQSFDSVCVLAPMHQYYPQPLLTSAHRAYHTPLGDIPLADDMITEINARLTERIGVGLTAISNDNEHSLEIELPFLQVALSGNFRLIPIMLREQSRYMTKALGEVLAEVIEFQKCLLVASSDLSHFYTQSQAEKLDLSVLKMLSTFSPEGLFDLHERGQGQACGLAPMAAVLWAAAQLGATEVTLLKYDTSAATTGDTHSVVGYGAAAITRPI